MNIPHPVPNEPTRSMDPAYAHRLQCARQWRGFLVALGQEFVGALPAQELVTLMARIGVRFAGEHALAPSETVPALQDEMNRVWNALDWGVVELGQTAAGMEIEHRFSPLAAAFGEDEAPWATGFLQGVYQQWFDAAGAAGLKVETLAQADAWGSARFRLVAA